jgi:RNA-splicing ligase RtcB
MDSLPVLLTVDSELGRNHNYAAREEQLGRTYWVVRKGCTPAWPGQEGFVGGSIGDESVVLEGGCGSLYRLRCTSASRTFSPSMPARFA